MINEETQINSLKAQTFLNYMEFSEESVQLTSAADASIFMSNSIIDQFSLPLADDIERQNASYSFNSNFNLLQEEAIDDLFLTSWEDYQIDQLNIQHDLDENILIELVDNMEAMAPSVIAANIEASFDEFKNQNETDISGLIGDPRDEMTLENLQVLLEDSLKSAEVTHSNNETLNLITEGINESSASDIELIAPASVESIDSIYSSDISSIPSVATSVSKHRAPKRKRLEKSAAPVDKKESNKQAANKYRSKKIKERDELFKQVEEYAKIVEEKKKKIEDIQTEISLIKSLLVQALITKNNSLENKH